MTLWASTKVKHAQYGQGTGCTAKEKIQRENYFKDTTNVMFSPLPPLPQIPQQPWDDEWRGRKHLASRNPPLCPSGRAFRGLCCARLEEKLRYQLLWQAEALARGAGRLEQTEWGNGYLHRRKTFFCKSFSLFPFGFTSAACGSVIVPPQEPVLSSGGLNSLIIIRKPLWRVSSPSGTHGRYTSSGISSGQNTRRWVRKKKLLFQTKCLQKLVMMI